MLISLEGTEGCGKTTLANNLLKYFAEKKLDAVYTREPGGSMIAEKIRDVLLDPKHTAMDPRCEALLYAASRRQHLVEKIIPALEAGKIVLCDRYIDSSLVYQGIARHIGIAEVEKINQFAIGDYYPDLTFFLDLDPKTGLERINRDHSREVNRLDMETLAFHQTVYAGYQEIAKRYPERIMTIDASRSPELVLEDVIARLESRLNL